ncbi:MAG: MFS transporter [Nocardioides sp.]
MTTAYDDPRRWWALAALALAVLTLGFDITIMNVALPTIATELEVGTDALQWIINSYVLVLAGLMLTCGALGDRYGRKRLLLLGLSLFGRRPPRPPGPTPRPW